MSRQPSYRLCGLVLLVLGPVIVSQGPAFALECPIAPEQVRKDWQVEVNATVAKIGPVSGGELKTKTQNAAQDLLSKLPDAGKLYLEQMMYAAYCSALRDDKTISETRKAQLIREYNAEVRSALSGQPRSREPTTKPPTRATAPATIDPKKARFGVSLGWQLARFEFLKDSPFAEARAAAPEVQEQIRTLLHQDGYPQSVEGLQVPQLMRNVLMYYGTTDLEKHAAILIGIAAMRASLIGASSNPDHNEEMKRLAFSALGEIDDSVLRKREEFFQELLRKRPTTVPATLTFLAGAKLR